MAEKIMEWIKIVDGVPVGHPHIADSLVNQGVDTSQSDCGWEQVDVTESKTSDFVRELGFYEVENGFEVVEIGGVWTVKMQKRTLTGEDLVLRKAEVKKIFEELVEKEIENCDTLVGIESEETRKDIWRAHKVNLQNYVHNEDDPKLPDVPDGL